MKNILKSSFAFLFSAIFCSTFAQDKKDLPLEKSLDALLSSKFQASTPGAEILVAKKGRVIYNKGFGSANLELNIPVRPGMVFKLGSITKQFTAVAILQLVEQGKIALHDSLQQYVPDFPSKGYTITIENLLTHTSGIKDYMQIDYPTPYLERWDFSPKQLIDSFKNFPLNFEPGTQYSYSNSGYFLLGYIIEKVSGRSYQSYIRDSLLTPLGLTNTYFDTSNIIIPGRVNGYVKDENTFKNASFWSMTITYSAGGLISSTDDLFKWHKGLLSYKLLKKESLDKAFIPFKLKNGISTGYGYGWIIRDVNGIHSIEHAGAINGFVTNEIYYPSEDVFIAALFNCECAPRDELSIDISAMALGKTLQDNISLSESILNDYIGTYSLVSDPQRTIDIVKEKNNLVGKVQGEGTYQLVFQSDKKFEFKNILGAKCEFVKENGKVVKFTVNQNGLYEWKKIK